MDFVAPTRQLRENNWELSKQITSRVIQNGSVPDLPTSLSLVGITLCTNNIFDNFSENRKNSNIESQFWGDQSMSNEILGRNTRTSLNKRCTANKDPESNLVAKYFQWQFAVLLNCLKFETRFNPHDFRSMMKFDVPFEIFLPDYAIQFHFGFKMKPLNGDFWTMRWLGRFWNY